MKLIPLCCIVLFFAHTSYAQDDIPEFGNFDRKDISIKECGFDKDADAVILFHVSRSNYNDEHNLITNHRIRFKILKEKGIERANIEISYYRKEDLENVSEIRATSYTVEDNGATAIKQLDKKAIFDQKINELYSIAKFTVPNVKVGTIIDYEYTVFSKHYGFLKDWYFQTDMPAILSRYALTVIPNAEFSYVVHKSSTIPVKIDNDKNSGTVTFEMRNIGGLRQEPYMDAAKDYLQYVEFQLSGYRSTFGSKVNYMTTWKEVAQELMSDYSFGKQIGKDLANSEEIIKRANAFTTPYDKMNFIYTYVRNNFSWNHFYSFGAQDGLKSVWANKKGNSGELNLILINLLKQADLEVYPLLVSERGHGKVHPNLPLIDQFNKVVAYTVIGDTKFVLDATNTNTPTNMIPFDLLNTNALIVNTKKPEVITLAGNAKGAFNYVTVSSTINDDGVLNGYAMISSFNYAKINRLEDYRENKENFQHEYFEKDYPEIKIDSFETMNTEMDSVGLQQQFNFVMPAATSGDYKLINVNLFTGIEKNPFTLDNRFTDIDFGCTHSTVVNESFELPTNFKPEEIPKNVQLITPDKSISFIRRAELSDNTINIQISLKVNGTIYPAGDYPILKEFYKKMYDLLNEQIVLSKKL